MINLIFGSCIQIANRKTSCCKFISIILQIKSLNTLPISFISTLHEQNMFYPHFPPSNLLSLILTFSLHTNLSSSEFRLLISFHNGFIPKLMPIPIIKLNWYSKTIVIVDYQSTLLAKAPPDLCQRCFYGMTCWTYCTRYTFVKLLLYVFHEYII